MSDPTNIERTEKSPFAFVAVGHYIDNRTGEAGVVLGANPKSGRLSPDGARILAGQLQQWADHADKFNAARPARETDSHVQAFTALLRHGWQPADTIGKTNIKFDWKPEPENPADRVQGKEGRKKVAPKRRVKGKK